MNAPHDHARPDLADMRAALGTARAILDGASHGKVHEAAAAGSCPECTAVAGIWTRSARLSGRYTPRPAGRCYCSPTRTPSSPNR